MTFKHYVIIFLSLLFISCSTVQKTTESTRVTSKKITKEIIKDTVFSIKKDSSFYKAYIECINNKPVLVTSQKKEVKNKEGVMPKEIPGEFLKPPNVHLKGNILSVTCEAKAQQLFVKWKEQHVQEQITKTKTITLPPKIIEKQLSWWQKLWIAVGKILIAIVSIWLLTKISWKNLLPLFMRLLKNL